MGLSGLEPPTSRLSGVRSNQLSYKPFLFFFLSEVPFTSFQERPKKLTSPFALLGLANFFRSGGHLLSHAVSSAVPSAVRVLTVVFGMGTGVSPGRIAASNVRYPSIPQQ